MCEQTLIHTCSQEYPGSARCVQSFDDSLDSAIRITYRISLRSSSMREPRHPSLKVVWHSVSPRRRARSRSKANTNEPTLAAQIGLSLAMEADSKGFGCGLIYKKKDRLLTLPPPGLTIVSRHMCTECWIGMDVFV